MLIYYLVLQWFSCEYFLKLQNPPKSSSSFIYILFMFDKTEVVVGGQWGGGSVVLTASTLSLSWNRTVSLWYICCVRLDVVESDGWPRCLTGVVTSSRSAADGRKLLNVTWSSDGWWDVKYKIIYDQQPDRQQCRDGGRGRGRGRGGNWRQFLQMKSSSIGSLIRTGLNQNPLSSGSTSSRASVLKQTGNHVQNQS